MGEWVVEDSLVAPKSRSGLLRGVSDGGGGRSSTAGTGMVIERILARSTRLVNLTPLEAFNCSYRYFIFRKTCTISAESGGFRV